jgi:xanthine/CO dehydrogenase XdhC/CoxF family maturation factor
LSGDIAAWKKTSKWKKRTVEHKILQCCGGEMRLLFRRLRGAREEHIATIVMDLLIFHDHLRRFASGSIALVIDAHERSTADAFYDVPDAI